MQFLKIRNFYLFSSSFKCDVQITYILTFSNNIVGVFKIKIFKFFSSNDEFEFRATNSTKIKII